MTDPAPNGAPLAEVKEAVLATAKEMHRCGLVEGTAGNVSGRVDDGTVVVTPSSLDYPSMTLDDLVVVTLDGEKVAGERSATSEKGVHLATLAAYPEVGAVVHCHAVHASMFAVAHIDIPAAIQGSAVRVNTTNAVRAAQAYLRAAHVTGTVTPTANHRGLVVTVTVTQPTVFLKLAGVSSYTVRSTAEATLVSGVTGAGR